VQTDTEIAENYDKQQQPAVFGKFAFGRYAAGCLSVLMGLVTLIFDLLTLKLACESHQRWGTFITNLSTLGLRVLELFAMYATDGRTDGQNQRILPSFVRAGA